MKRNSVLLVAAGALILSGVWLWFSRGDDAGFTPVESGSLGIDVGQVEKIQFEKRGFGGNENAYTLNTIIKVVLPDRVVWRIPELGNADVNPERITRFLELMSTLRGEYVGEVTEQEKTAGLGRNGAFRVSFFDRKWTPLLALLIGDEMEDGNIFYRIDSSNQVYRTPTNILSAIGINNPKADKPEYTYWSD